MENIIDKKHWENVWKCIDEAVEKGEIPGAVAAVDYHGTTVSYAAGDRFKTEQYSEPVSQDTVYDCASLTKVVVTLPLILMLHDRGGIRLQDRVMEYLPEFAVHGKDHVTIEQLVTHTSGLAAHTNLQAHGRSEDEMINYICRMHPQYDPGTKVVYSCLGYILLGRIAAQCYGVPLDQAAHTHLFHPLGMNHSCYNPPVEWRSRIAATEMDSRTGGFKWGRVHDENAYGLGGISGNAGLFSTAHDLIQYGRLWLGISEGIPDLLSASIKSRAVENRTSHVEGAYRGWGWVLKGDQWDASGERMSPASYGHTGFTGTSLWVDPQHHVIAVLLTNRVHFGRDKSVAPLRRSFHNAIIDTIISGKS